MIKPCSGLSPEQAGEQFYEAALGGIDIAKDDDISRLESWLISRK